MTNRAVLVILALTASCAGSEDVSTRAPELAQPRRAEAQRSVEETSLEGLATAKSIPDQRSDASPTFPALVLTKDAPAPHLADCELTLTRSMCFGYCPAYSVTMHGDGTVVYVGELHVATEGRAESRIDVNLLASILREMESIDFVHHDHTCVGLGTDASSIRVTLRIGGSSRTVEVANNEVLCSHDLPSHEPEWHAAIQKIGERVDRAVDIERWIGTLEQRRALRSRPR